MTYTTNMGSRQIDAAIEHKWNPENYINPSLKNNKNHAVIILNRPILLENNLFIKLWNEATIRMTVDGGTNQWLNFYKNSNEKETLKEVDLVTGDFDSITEESLDFVNKCKKSQIIKTYDQNETDFTKSLRVLETFVQNKQINFVLTIAETSGRIDQIMANINTLFKAQSILPQNPVFILSRSSISWLLVPGKHLIEIPPEILEKRKWCSLVPIREKCVATSVGLKWDLNNTTLEFGRLVSTSNTYNGNKVVEITTDGYLLWSMGFGDEN